MNFSRLRWRGASMERRGWRMAQGRNASTLNIFLHVHVSCQRTFIFGYQNAAHSIFRSISENVLVDALRQMKTKCVIWERTKHTQKLIQNAICLAQSRVCSSSGWFGHVTERSAGLSIRAPTHTHTTTQTHAHICNHSSSVGQTCTVLVPVAFATAAMAMIMMRHMVLALGLLLVTLTVTGEC